MDEFLDEVEQALERFSEHMPEGNDITLITLKGHLLVEEKLVAITEAAVPNPHELPNFRFKARLQTVKALYGNQAKHVEPCFKLINALNELRNKLAHNLDPTGKEQLVKNVIQARHDVRACIEGKPALHAEGTPGELRGAIGYALFFLSRVLTHVQSATRSGQDLNT